MDFVRLARSVPAQGVIDLRAYERGRRVIAPYERRRPSNRKSHNASGPERFAKTAGMTCLIFKSADANHSYARKRPRFSRLRRRVVDLSRMEAKKLRGRPGKQTTSLHSKKQIDRCLSIAGGSEDCARIVAQDPQPCRDVSGVVGAWLG